MNSLFWMLYLADVVSSISVASFIFVAISAVAMMFLGIMAAFERFDEYGLEGLRSVKRILSAIRVPILIATCSLVVFIAAPSKTTIYAKAAVTIGGEVAATEEFRLLREFLLKELRKLSQEKSK